MTLSALKGLCGACNDIITAKVTRAVGEGEGMVGGVRHGVALREEVNRI